MDHDLVTLIPSEMHWAVANAARKLHGDYNEQFRRATDLADLIRALIQQREAARIEGLAYNAWACQAYSLDAPL